MNARGLRALSVALLAMACLFATRLAHAATIVACVGDSITAGAWPGKLGTLLGSNYTVNNYGVSGTTLLKNGDFPYWNTGQFTQSHTVMPNIVVIMLGTNDSKPQNWDTHKGEYAGDYEALIDSYTVLASKPRIFLNLPPPAGTNGFNISGTIIENEILPLVRQTAIKKGVGLIDVFSAFGGHNFDPSLYGSTTDQVHPGDKGAQRIADTVYAALIAPPDAGTSAKDAAAESAAKDASTAPEASGGSGGSAAGSGGAGGAPGSGGSAGSQASAGSAGTSATTGSDGAGGTSSASTSPPPAADEGSCGCRIATVPSDRAALWVVALLGVIVTRRRRTRC
jgi:MYXO-CTERM domain-containing protein